MNQWAFSTAVQAHPGRWALVSDRWQLRLLVLAMVIFAVSMAAALGFDHTRVHRPSAVERGHYARIAPTGVNCSGEFRSLIASVIRTGAANNETSDHP
jgi:hypothetical protein